MQIVKKELATKELVGGIDQLLDVRASYEWHDTGVVENSKLVSLYDDSGLMNDKFVDEVLAMDFDKDKPLYIICHSSARSVTAAQILTRCGFSDAISLDGGISKLMYDGLELKRI